MRGPSPAASPHPAWVVAGLYLIGIGFGFVEAAVVVDLRVVLAPRDDRTEARLDGELFPMVPPERLARENPTAGRLLRVEVMREAATLVLLAGAGIAIGRSFVGRFAAFVAAFGVWDLTYYVFLKFLIGWPASVWTWDILFLVPVPWSAPVLAPAVVAATMVAAGSVVLVEEARGRPFRISGREWAAIVMGGVILSASFCWDWRAIAAGEMPGVFPWPVFLLGEAVGLGGFAHAWSSGWLGARECLSTS
ncbi:MAG: hypothetical protein ACYC61_19435 [Isosphaeraceae bacterium]